MRYVLCVCTHNAGRSQIGQALFERCAPDDVPIRSHILTLAHKQTRDRLRQEHCAPL